MRLHLGCIGISSSHFPSLLILFSVLMAAITSFASPQMNCRTWSWEAEGMIACHTCQLGWFGISSAHQCVHSVLARVLWMFHMNGIPKECFSLFPQWYISTVRYLWLFPKQNTSSLPIVSSFKVTAWFFGLSLNSSKKSYQIKSFLCMVDCEVEHRGNSF